MAHNKAKLAQVASRRTELIKLRLQGIRFDDERVLELGYTNSGSARKDLIRALEQHREEEAAAIGVYRQQENERLDALLEAVWNRATVPHPIFDKEGVQLGEEIDVRAIDTVIRLIDRRAKLNGLDMPVKAEVTGADGGPLAMVTASPDELADLIAATSRLDVAQPANTKTSTPDEDDDEDEESEG
ncbi:hypothetical protein PV382_43200 [Streptomyces scabiei]|uniref:hypothetical protein n=1 Tax=Streptomyces scabiei TaxID=1930 RepID=UPI000765B694|nr:hypothetical protein [Streptomyces scabiei]MDX2999345.1 hypothetical protein [Streptomyces scabiei]MDX3052914.1 hypothetical protein [Streptomyces scabiei]MDX3178996.1 hypothetical protein [Streptomyces scabiei]